MNPHDSLASVKIALAFCMELLMLFISWTFIIDTAGKLLTIIFSIVIFIYARKKFIQDSINAKLEEQIKRTELENKQQIHYQLLKKNKEEKS